MSFKNRLCIQKRGEDVTPNFYSQTRYTNLNLLNDGGNIKYYDNGSMGDSRHLDNCCNKNKAEKNGDNYLFKKDKMLQISSPKSSFLFNSDYDDKCLKQKHQFEKKDETSATRSTLSLHIAAYENSNENKNLCQVEKQNPLHKALKNLKLNSQTAHRDTFEFPRQQDTVSSDPEVMQFKASQQLLNVNAEEPPNKKQKQTEISQPSTSSLPSTIIVQSKPPEAVKLLSSSTTTPKYTAPAKPIIFTPMESESYIDPDPDINKFVELQKKKEKEPQNPEPQKPPARLKTREEILEEQVKELEAKNEYLNNELKRERHNSSQRKYKQKKKASKESAEDENMEDRNLEDMPRSSRHHLINDIWQKLQTDYSPQMAAQIITAIYNTKIEAEAKALTPAQTLQLLKNSGISIEALRKIRSDLNNFNVSNPFASDRAVNEERAKIHQSVKFKTEKVKMRNTVNGPKVETDVHYRESVLEELTERINDTINSGNYEPFFHNGEEVIAGVVTQDKATDYSKVCMGLGNTKRKKNSAYALSLLCYFKANDSQENLYSAMDREGGIGPQIDNIKEITVTINGETKTLKVVWFAVGDFKFLNAIAGLNSNSCLFPCWNCIQKTETTYAELNMDLQAAERENAIDESKSQIREPLFKTIPFERFIPPVLHMTLGPGAQLFEALFERARQLDTADLQSENIEELLSNDKAQKSWASSQEKIEKLQEELERLNYQKNLFENVDDEAPYSCQSRNCVAIRDNINVNSIYEINNFCYQCQAYFHKCCLYKGNCPHCNQRYPTPKQCQAVIDQDRKEIEKKIKQTSKLMNDEEEKNAAIISKFKIGSLTRNLEKVLGEHGGTKKAFFQSYTGKQLTSMGSEMREIFFELDEKLQSDPEIQKINRAIIKFFDIRKLLTTKIYEDHEIDVIETKIKEFAAYMKQNLPNFRVLQKGHTFLKHLVPFMRKYKIAAYFTDEAIESYHVVFNKYDRRINNRSSEKYAQLMFYYNKEDTFLYDRFGYVPKDN